jgi:hypothetical protein
MSELNSRQWALYNFLKERGDEWTVQAEIAAALPEYNYDGEEEYAKFHDSPARMLMTADIRAINESAVIQKVIIASSKGIKIANAAEFDRYIRKEIMAAVRRLMRAKYKASKGNMDGQTRIVFGSERDTIKAFIDSDKAVGERLRDARIKAGLKAVDVVRLLNIKSVDAPMLSRFEKGYCAPNSTTLFRLAEIYGVQPYYLTMGEEHTPAANAQN